MALSDAQLRGALESFELPGRLVSIAPLRRGHIHDTFVSTWEGEGARRLVHQRMNRSVFPDLDLLMENVRRVTEHMLARLGEAGADGFEPLRLIPTREGRSYAQTSDGAWRTFVYIEGTSSFDRCESPRQAWEAARAFGWFQAQLRDLPAGELGETLESFFSSPFRYRQFHAALGGAGEDRRASAAAEIDFALEREAGAGLIDELQGSGEMPARVVHGDTKLNNILFDDATGKARGIVDLDTCMPGYSLYDFGDLVRFTAATSDEDETDLERVGTDLEVYAALADGYLTTARSFLAPREIELMPFAARLVTLTIGLRFLTDHLAGDVYFKVAHPGHNLERARVQFGMVDFMERHEERMRVR